MYRVSSGAMVFMNTGKGSIHAPCLHLRLVYWLPFAGWSFPA